MSYHKKIVRVLIAALFFVFIKAGGIGFRDFQKNFGDFQRIGNNFLEKKEQWSAEVGVEFSFNGFFKDFEFEKAYLAIAIGVVAIKYGIDLYKRKKIEIGHSEYPLSIVYQSEGFGSSLSPPEIESLKELDFQRKLAFYMKENYEELKPLLENLFAAYEIYNLCNLHKFIYSCAKEILFDKDNLHPFQNKVSLKEKFKNLLSKKFKFTKKVCSDFYKENENKSFKKKCKNLFLKLIGKKPKQEIKIDKISIDEVILNDVVLDKLSDNLSEIFLDDSQVKLEQAKLEQIKFEQVKLEQKELEQAQLKELNLKKNEKLEYDKKFLTEISENNFEINLLNLDSPSEHIKNEHLINEKKTQRHRDPTNRYSTDRSPIEGPPRLEVVTIALLEIAKDSLTETLKNSIENPKNLILNSLFGEFIFAYDASKVFYNLGKIGINTISDYEKGKNEFFQYTQPVSDIFNFLTSSSIQFKDKARVLTSFFLLFSI